MTIYLFLRYPYSERIHHHYGGSFFPLRGFNFEVWIFPFLGGQKTSQCINSNSEVFSPKKPLVFRSKLEASLALKKLEANSIILDPASVLVDPDMPFHENINDCYKAILDLQSLPSLPSSFSHLLSRLFSLPFYTFRLLLRKIIGLSGLYNKLLPRKVFYDLGVAAGKLSRLKLEPLVNKKTGSILNAHSPDCELLLHIKNQTIPVLPSDYALFLDEFLPYHPDYEVLGIKQYASPDPYYYELNNYFKWFESCHGLQVVIAAHPKSNYSSQANPFQGRTIYHHKTPLLVSHSALCFTHCSTAVSFAILKAKPIISLCSSSYSPIFNRRVAHMSNIICSSLIDVSSCRNYGPKHIPQPCMSFYQKYTNDYLYEGAPPSLPFLESLLHSLPKS